MTFALDLLVLWLGYLAWAVAMYWIPLVAVCTQRRSKKPLPFPNANTGERPFLYIVAPCRNAAASLPGFVHGLKKQSYPSDRFRVLILADNCSDPSARVARSLSVAVYERQNPQLMGKGYALNELLQQKIQHEPFDALLLFDIDARIDPAFLERVASHIQKGAQVLQGSTISKNPMETVLTRVGDAAQALIRSHQSGRALLGLHPMMIGSHGIVLSRESLKRLGWRINTDRGGDDIELGLRCYVRGLPVRYAPDLAVANDLPAGANAIRKQRRRWTRSVFRLTPKYMGPLLKKGITSDWRAFEILLNLLLNPSFSNLFLFLTATTGFLILFSLSNAGTFFFTRLSLFLWLSYTLYLIVSLKKERVLIKWTDTLGFLSYVGIRGVALVEALFLVRSKDWWPTAHGSDPSIDKNGLPQKEELASGKDIS